MIPLRIATKLSMTKSVSILENYHRKEMILKIYRRLLTSTSHAAKVGSMASAGYQVTPTDVGKFSNFFLSFVSFPIYCWILLCSTLLQFARVSTPLQAPVEEMYLSCSSILGAKI